MAHLIRIGSGTRWGHVLRKCAAEIHREIRVTVAPAARPEKWVFVVGCYNSGTTLIRKILGAHPSVSILPAEGQYLTDQFPSDHEIGLSRMWVEREDLYRLTENDDGPNVYRIKKEWATRLDRKRPIFLDQTPANSARTRWLQRHFEPAYFIAMIRNGYAVAEGIRRKAQPIHRKSGWPIEMAARQWRRSNEILFEDAPLLRNLLWMKYEDLATNPTRELTRLWEFLGLDKSSIPNPKLNWSVHERSQGIVNLNAESIGRLSRDDIMRINAEAGGLLAKTGYEELIPE